MRWITLIDRYQRCSNTLRRLLEALGLQRRAKDVTPTLSRQLDELAFWSVEGNHG
jgi:hypothetical protein